MLLVLARVHGVPQGGESTNNNEKRVNNILNRRNVMGELLEIASWVATPIGAVCAIAAVAALYFFGRWVLTD
jgi:hypothetical protein